MSRTRSAPLFLVPPSPVRRCAVCRRPVPLDPMQFTWVFRALWSGYTCSPRCAAVALGSEWRPPVDAVLLLLTETGVTP